MAAGTAIVATPSASAEGTSHGEITVTNGNVSKVRGGKAIGTNTAAIVAVNSGTPPTKTSAHAILKPLNASRYKVSFFFID
jgi:hypothetical protein